MEDQAGRISPELQEAMEAPRSNTQVVSRKKHVNMVSPQIPIGMLRHGNC